MAANDDRIVALSADLAGATHLKFFKDSYPDRFYNVGVAEGNMVGVAVGLATCGLIPFVSSFAAFISMRACEQVRTDVCYTRQNVKFVVTHSGLSYGWGGPSHVGIEDIAIIRTFPNMQIIVPADYTAISWAVEQAVAHPGPVYIRLGRNAVPVVYDEYVPLPLEWGKAHCLRSGSDVTLIANGPMVYECLLAADELATEGISARVLDMHTVKPLDQAALVAAARETGAIVTVEEHHVSGGLGGAVAEVLSEVYPVRIRRVGVPDQFPPSGAPEVLRDYLQLRASRIATEARALISSAQV